MISLTIEDCTVRTMLCEHKWGRPCPMSEVTMSCTGTLAGMPVDAKLTISVFDEGSAEFNRMLEEIIKDFMRRGVCQDERPLQPSDQHD